MVTLEFEATKKIYFYTEKKNLILSICDRVIAFLNMFVYIISPQTNKYLLILGR